MNEKDENNKKALEDLIIPVEINNPIIKRLIEEIKWESKENPNRLHAFNRTHNRHNRSR